MRYADNEEEESLQCCSTTVVVYRIHTEERETLGLSWTGKQMKQKGKLAVNNRKQ
jgi:hypothetical protein